MSELQTIKSHVESSSQNSDSDSDYDINAGNFSDSQSDEYEEDDSFEKKYMDNEGNELNLPGVNGGGLVTPAGEKL